MQPQPAFELDTRPANPLEDEGAQALAANIWRDMRRIGAKDVINPAPLKPEQEPKPIPTPPENPKVRFDEPFSPDKAKALIPQLGSTRYSEREAAQDKLMRMGEPVIPLLEEAGKRSRDIEIQSRTATTARKIRDGVEQNISIDARRTFRENEADWKGLLAHAGKRIIDQKDAPNIMNDAGEIVPLGNMILVGSGKSAPSKEEQQRYDKMLEQFRALPDFSSALEHAEERAKMPDATLKERMDSEQLRLLKIAKESVELDYARALSASKDPADLKKGRGLMLDNLKGRKAPLDEHDNFKMLELALDLHVDSDPEILDALKKAGGKTERLEDMRLDRVDRANEERVRARDKAK